MCSLKRDQFEIILKENSLAKPMLSMRFPRIKKNYHEKRFESKLEI